MDILMALAEGKRGAVARSTEVARTVLAQPAELPVLLSAVEVTDPAIVSHASHALLSVFKVAPELLQKHRVKLLQLLLHTNQWEAMEQLSKIVPHLGLDDASMDKAVSHLSAVFHTHKSSIARTCALQAVVDFAATDTRYKPQAQDLLSHALEKGSKAMQARARRILSGSQP